MQPIGDCGKKQGCYLNPPACIKNKDNCDLVYKWSDSQLSTNFELSAKLPLKDAWLGIGFSNHNSMGDNCAVLCLFTNNTGDVQHMYSNGKSTPVVLTKNDPNIGINNIKVSVENGEMTCSFTRIKMNSNVTNYFDLNIEYFLLTAYGPYSPSYIGYHTFKQVGGTKKTNFLQNQIVDGLPTYPKLQYHGGLMSAAWMLFASIAIIIARYHKYLFPDTSVFGVKVWFFVHRLFMLITVALTIAGFVVIFWHMDWKWQTKIDKTNFAHSITGIITIGLVLIQVTLN
jgi:hypothetical protein